MKAETRTWAFQSEKKYGPLPDAYNYRSLCPAVGEVVGNRLMRTLGIGTAPSVEIVENEEARRRDPRQWIFKPIAGGRLKVDSSELVGFRWVLLVEKIPNAIPVSFLRKQYGIDTGKIEITTAENALPPPTGIEFTIEGNVIPPGKLTPWIIWAGKPELPNAAEFYGDFVPPSDWSAVRRAISWDGEQMLAIHAARLFLGASVAHASNVLVDAKGFLYSIDHEFCTATGGEDLWILFDDIKAGTRAFEALRGIAQLSEEKLCELFEDIPVPDGARWFRWPLGSKENTVAHYLKRLRIWQLNFAKLSLASLVYRVGILDDVL